MRKLAAKAALLALILVLLAWAWWPDGRPGVSGAETVFEQLYPGVQVLSVQISEEEVVARSFRIKYRKPGTDTAGEIGIQFMKNEATGRWEPIPAPPEHLP